MRATKLLFQAALMWACALGCARADLYVVVRSDNPVRAMSKLEVRDVFMGRTRAFPSGAFAQPFDLARDDPSRASFHYVLTGLSEAQVNSYWSRLMFSGQTMPPQTLEDESAMRQVIKRNPNAIGYLSQPPVDPELRVVLVLKDQP